MPESEGGKIEKKKLKSYPIGYFLIDITEIRTAAGKLYLFVAIDRTSKLAYMELVKMKSAQFLRNLIKFCPYKIDKILIDNGIQFPNRKRNIHEQAERMNRTIQDATVNKYFYESYLDYMNLW